MRIGNVNDRLQASFEAEMAETASSSSSSVFQVMAQLAQRVASVVGSVLERIGLSSQKKSSGNQTGLEMVAAHTKPSKPTKIQEVEADLRKKIEQGRKSGKDLFNEFLQRELKSIT